LKSSGALGEAIHRPVDVRLECAKEQTSRGPSVSDGQALPATQKAPSCAPRGISIGLVYCDRHTKSATATKYRSNIRRCRRALLWRTRSKLRGESVGEQPCPHSGSPGCLCRWQAVQPPQLAVWQQISRRGTLQRVTKSLWVRRKSLTSAWRRSTFSTRKTPEHPSTAKD
jgi:hypothetical protein